MRQLIHNILSGFPALALSVLALILAANPALVMCWYSSFSTNLQDPRILSACIALVTAYSIVWVYTGIKGMDRRTKIRERLQPFYAETAQVMQVLQRQTTDQDCMKCIEIANATQRKLGDWLRDNVGAAAVAKLVSVKGQGLGWPWEGEHDPSVVKQRDHALNVLFQRLANLQEIMEHGNWDGRVPSRLAKSRHWLAMKLATKFPTT